MVKGEAWTVADVLFIADAFEQIHSALRDLIDSLPTGPYVYPLRRNIAERIERFFSDMLGENFFQPLAKKMP
jgi:hypothetical protein